VRTAVLVLEEEETPYGTPQTISLAEARLHRVDADTPSSPPTAARAVDGARPTAFRTSRHGSAVLLDRWRKHLPAASAALLPLLEEAANKGSEFPHAERALFMACEFWTAVATRTLPSYLGADPTSKLRYMGIVYSAMGASDISDTVNRAANDLPGFAALRERQIRLLALEARLLSSPDSVDRMIARLVRTMTAVSDTCSEEPPADVGPRSTPWIQASRMIAPPQTQMRTPAPPNSGAARLPRVHPESLDDQVPSGMDYDLRRRLETFASGNCSSEAFLRELSTQCDAAPDFIWDVLALIDQYQRRGKIPAEFQRSIRELIERPALTHQRPQVFSAELEQLKEPAVAAASVVAAESSESVPSQASSPSVTQAEELLERGQEPAAHPAQAPLWAANHEIIVPTLYELCRPKHDPKAADRGGSELLPAPASASSRSGAFTRLKIAARHIGIGEFDVTAGGLGRRRIRQVRSIQIALLAALFSCVTASSALRSLSMATRSVAVVATAPPPPLPAPSISLSSDRYLVYPGGASAVIQVERTGDPSADISFVWWTRESGAKSGKDYRGSRPRTEHLPAGVNSVQWSIPIFPNAARRHTELFYVAIGSPGGGAAVGAATRATVFVMGPN